VKSWIALHIIKGLDGDPGDPGNPGTIGTIPDGSKIPKGHPLESPMEVPCLKKRRPAGCGV